MARKRNKRNSRSTGRKKTGGSDRQLLAEAFEFHQRGEFQRAEAIYRKILQSDPDHVDALQLSGMLAHQKGLYEEAIELISRAISANPNVAAYHHNLGVSLQAIGKRSDALFEYREAARLKPDYTEALNNLGVMLQENGDFAAAADTFKQALNTDPASDYAHYNLASCYRVRGDFDAAVRHCKAALSLNPVYVDAHCMRAGYLLAEERYPQGWREYEWRRYSGKNADKNLRRIAPFPKWDGRVLAKSRIMVFSEQGIGDEIMFASCLPDLIAVSKDCIIECDIRLVSLFARSFPTATVVARHDDNDFSWSKHHLPIDCRISAGSLPGFFRCAKTDFPSRRRYLHAAPALCEKWRRRLARLGKPMNVGISWRGGVEKNEKQLRSIPLRRWQGILSSKDANIINLQYGDHGDEIADIQSVCPNSLVNLEGLDPLANLAEVAALISVLDLVITIDNSTAHLAGALGTPAWVLLPRGGNWRWLRSGGVCRWYSMTRVFRQSEPGVDAWAPVIAEVADELRSFGRLSRESEQTADIAERTDSKGSRPARHREPGAATGRDLKVLLLNDTTSWYHWGCACTSVAIHQQLRDLGCSIVSSSINATNQLVGLPDTIDGFDDDQCFAKFSTDNSPLLTALDTVDAVVINGEGTLHGMRAVSVGLLYLGYIAKQRFGKPVQIINHSCYPDDSAVVADNLAYALYKKVYDQFDFIGVREIVSAKILTEMELDVTVTFDCLPLFIERNYLARRQTKQDYVVLAGSVAWNSDTIPAFDTLVKTLVRGGYLVKVLIGANAYPAADDFDFVTALHKVCAGEFELVNATSENDWLRTIAGAKVVVSGRFHHSIAAVFLNTPFVVIESNTPKIDGLLSMVSLKNKVSNTAPNLGQTLLQTVDAMLAEPARGLVDESLRDYLRELSRLNFGGMIRLLQQGGP